MSGSQKNKSNMLVMSCIIGGVIIGIVTSSIDLGTTNKLVWVACGDILMGVMFFVGWVVFTAARNVQKAPIEEDRLAKNFTPVTDKGVVYIFRDQFIGVLKALPINVSDQQVGWIKGKNFIRLELPAGEYTLGGNKTCKQPTVFQIANGEILYFEQEIVAGMLSGSYIYNKIDDSNQAQSKIKLCSLVKNKV